MERLREHLGIERWLLYGGSWGSTLILAYAERHPDRVSAIVISGVTTTRRSEIEWLYGGVGRFLPAEWERFRAGGDVAAYARRMEDPDAEERDRAAAAWVAWEDAVIAHERGGHPGAYSARVDEARLAFVRICAHYFSHGAWLEEGALLRDAGRLAGIPGVLDPRPARPGIAARHRLGARARVAGCTARDRGERRSHGRRGDEERDPRRARRVRGLGLERVELGRRLVLGQTALEHAAREHADELAAVHDRNALGVPLLQQPERLVQRQLRVDRPVRRLGQLADRRRPRVAARRRRPARRASSGSRRRQSARSR